MAVVSGANNDPSSEGGEGMSYIKLRGEVPGELSTGKKDGHISSTDSS
jgi:hypothetical protein